MEFIVKIKGIEYSRKSDNILDLISFIEGSTSAEQQDLGENTKIIVNIK